MTDAQNERTNGRNRRRGRRRNKNSNTESRPPVEANMQPPVEEPAPVAPPVEAAPAAEIRPDEIAAPTVRSEEYCVQHMANFTECAPMQVRSPMPTIRHLQVDPFGEATLYCDCLHNGPHEWPPSMQRLETAIELDQFKAASTNAA